MFRDGMGGQEQDDCITADEMRIVNQHQEVVLLVDSKNDVVVPEHVCVVDQDSIRRICRICKKEVPALQDSTSQ